MSISQDKTAKPLGKIDRDSLSFFLLQRMQKLFAFFSKGWRSFHSFPFFFKGWRRGLFLNLSFLSPYKEGLSSYDHATSTSRWYTVASSLSMQDMCMPMWLKHATCLKHAQACGAWGVTDQHELSTMGFDLSWSALALQALSALIMHVIMPMHVEWARHIVANPSWSRWSYYALIGPICAVAFSYESFKFVQSGPWIRILFCTIYQLLCHLM